MSDPVYRKSIFSPSTPPLLKISPFVTYGDNARGKSLRPLADFVYTPRRRVHRRSGSAPPGSSGFSHLAEDSDFPAPGPPGGFGPNPPSEESNPELKSFGLSPLKIPRREDRGPEYSIFVGDLGPEVNEYVLVSLFQARFPSCKSAKIMTDAMSGQSRGYGFVRFSDENDQQRALVEMQGVYCGNRPMRISTATPKNR